MRPCPGSGGEDMEPILKVSGLTKTFSRQGQADFTAVKNISFDLFPGCLLYTSDAADE